MSERLEIGFGKYRDRDVWECPESYLRWLVRQEARTDHFRNLQARANDALHCKDDGDWQDYANELRWDGQ